MSAAVPAIGSIASVTARIEAIESRFPSPEGFASVFARAAAPTSALPGVAAPTGGTSTAAVLAARQAPAAQESAAAPADASLADKVVSRAREFIGVPYVWGGEQRNGVDCSGLMVQVFEHFGIDVPRVSRDQARAGRPVSREDLAPGDMVFFDYSSSRPGVDHVGLYIGDGKMIHAPRPGSSVHVADVDWSAFTNARRVLPAADPQPAAAAAGKGVAVDALPAAGRQWADEITAAARAQGVDPDLLASLVWSESGFNASAKSPAGAIGLGQLMPGTAAELGVNPYKPAENLRGAATYLARQLDRFGTPELALAAYNAGPGNVSKYGGIPPFTETRNYVSTVMDRYRQLEGAR